MTMQKPTIGTRLGAAAVMVATFALAGCDQLGSPLDIVSGNRTAPDEFLVLARKPLRMPGSLDLPVPRLGERSPLEPDPNTAAVVALLGAPTVGPSTAGSSAGEQALLAAADATAANLPQQDLDLQEVERQQRENQPYEPPLLVDLLSGQAEIEDYEDALVPQFEARRLQIEGVAPAPIDPKDRPSLEPETPSAPAEEFNSRRPYNRLPSAPTETAF